MALMQYPKYYPTGLKDCESEVPRGEGSTRMGFEIGLKGEGLLFGAKGNSGVEVPRAEF